MIVYENNGSAKDFVNINSKSAIRQLHRYISGLLNSLLWSIHNKVIQI